MWIKDEFIFQKYVKKYCRTLSQLTRNNYRHETDLLHFFPHVCKTLQSMRKLSTLKKKNHSFRSFVNLLMICLKMLSLIIFQYMHIQFSVCFFFRFGLLFCYLANIYIEVKKMKHSKHAMLSLKNTNTD